jgi:hypothetical protein
MVGTYYQSLYGDKADLRLPSCFCISALYLNNLYFAPSMLMFRYAKYCELS